MKLFLIIMLFPFSVFSQELSLKEAMDVFDQHQGALSKVEVGLQLLNENYDIHGETCMVKRRTISTVVELHPGYALVHNDKKVINCDGSETLTKFMSKDVLVELEALKAQMLKSFGGWKIVRKENIVTFTHTVGTDGYTFQYDLNQNLFNNWLHYHHSYTGVESHNIKSRLPRKVIPMSETQGLPFCERDSLTLDVISCK